MSGCKTNQVGTVGEALVAASANLEKAKTDLDLVSIQYHSAKETYENAKTIYKALKDSQIRTDSSGVQHDQLCGFCKAISIDKIFERQQQPPKAHRQKVGDLFHAIENQSRCIFCRFLIEAFQIGSETQSERLHALLTPRDTAIYFARDSESKAWYTKAGIDTNLPACPFVWLQTGPPTLTGEPYICVSFKPTLDGYESTTSWRKEIYPRRRGALQAFNGSLDYELIKSWLTKCDTEHVAICKSVDTGSTSSLNIFLIDVSTKTFVRHRPGDRFVALSYVWGKRVQYPGSVSASRGASGGGTNDHGPTERETNQNLPTFIPQTMKDALTFVERIGERYAWIDQLCIDQTNEEEKQRQINIMDRIFAAAHLTIISLDGPDADWGLPGVSRPLLQTHQPTVRLNNGQLMATFVYSNWDNNGSSIWDSRGWTLQERLLSWRCIVFAKTYTSLVCRTGYYHDCITLDLEGKGVKIWPNQEFFREDGSGINLDDGEWDFKNFDALVSVFSGRELTHQSDALNACRGSLNRISMSAGVEFCFGLPVHDCLRALVWMPHHRNVITRHSGFPSWSWTGWQGRIEYAYWVGDMAAYLQEEPDEQAHRQGPPSKRRRMPFLEAKLTHPERAALINHPSDESQLPVLKLQTTVGKFKLRRVRQDGEILRNLKQNSQQSKNAIGDHWTLIGQDGHRLRDEAGEHQCFELTDSFFRLKSEYSRFLLDQDNEGDFVFIEHWPCIRDSAASNKWLYDMVSALLVIRNPDGTAWRLASVLLKGEEWYAKKPRPEIIGLV